METASLRRLTRASRGGGGREPPIPVTGQGAFRGGGTAGPGTVGPERALSLAGRRLWHPPMSSVRSREGSGPEGQRGPGKQSLLREWNHFLLDAAGWENTHLEKCRRQSNT